MRHILMRHILILIIAILLPLAAGAAQPPKTLPESDPKYRAVKGVFDRLTRVGNAVPPRLHILKSDKRDKLLFTSFGSDPFTGIMVNVQEKFVAMDEDIIDLMAGLGSERDNALAFLLGHELAHYAVWKSGGFASGRSIATPRDLCNSTKKEQRDICLAKAKKQQLADKAEQEARADRLGCWYAIEAGFNPFPAAELAIRAIYKRDYPDPSHGPEGYPTLAERIAIINRVRDELARKQPFFDGAGLLLSLGRYQEAARLYDYLAKDFQSRELLNNAGVAHSLFALALPPRSPYFYPFELDAIFRIPATAKGIDVENEHYRRELLTTAAGQFDQALRLDPEYGTAQLNRAAVAELLGEKNKLTYHLSEAGDLAAKTGDAQLLARVKIVQGIDLARRGKTEDAAALFTAARQQEETMAVSNLLAIGNKPNETPLSYFPDDAVVEAISGLSLTRPRDAARISPTTAAVELRDQFDTPISYAARHSSAWDSARLHVGKLSLVTVSTPAAYSAASMRGVRIGDKEGAVIGRYGRPNRVIATRSGSIMAYSRDSIIFAIDREQKVSSWTLYRTEEQ